MAPIPMILMAVGFGSFILLLIFGPQPFDEPRATTPPPPPRGRVGLEDPETPIAPMPDNPELDQATRTQRHYQQAVDAFRRTEQERRARIMREGYEYARQQQGDPMAWARQQLTLTTTDATTNAYNVNTNAPTIQNLPNAQPIRLADIPQYVPPPPMPPPPAFPVGVFDLHDHAVGQRIDPLQRPIPAAPTDGARVQDLEAMLCILGREHPIAYREALQEYEQRYLGRTGAERQELLRQDRTEFVRLMMANGGAAGRGHHPFQRAGHVGPPMRAEEARIVNPDTDRWLRDQAQACDRAATLLRDTLDERQREQYQRFNWFDAYPGRNHASERVFRINRESTFNVTELAWMSRKRRWVKWATYCVVAGADVPLDDQLLAQKLMIEGEPDRFLRIANRQAAPYAYEIPDNVSPPPPSTAPRSTA